VISFLKRLLPPAADNKPEEEHWSMMAVWFTSEVRMLETLLRYPQHPNIVKYHGCQVRKDRVTSIMLGRCAGDNQWDYLQSGKTGRSTKGPSSLRWRRQWERRTRRSTRELGSSDGVVK
jgi:hypothetical protein